jgi:hypothetical protein
MMVWAPMGMATDNTSFPYRGGTDNLCSQWVYADKGGLDRLSAKLSYGREFVTKKGAAGSLLAFDGGDVFGFYQDPTGPQSSLFGRVGGKRWDVELPPGNELRLTAILSTGDRLFVGGMAAGAEAAGKLSVFATADGRQVGEVVLPTGVRWDGLAAVGDRLYVAGATGVLTCLGGR